MGVYIKGMEMPTRCCECRLSTCHSFKERPLCDVLVKYMSYGEWEAKRLDDCPLVPVPPHGKWNNIIQGIIPSGQCSNCGAWDKVTRFCPNCGSQMEGE